MVISREMKIIKSERKWYIIVISAGMFILSLLCWMEFAKSCYNILISRFESKHVVGEKNADMSNDAGYTIGVQTENQQVRENIVVSYCELLDREVNVIDSVWCDAMYKKPDLSKIDTKLTYYTTGEFLSNQVIKGSGNWLFFKDTTVIGDYEGTNRYTQNEMDIILQTVLETQEEIEKKGIEFVVLVAPNKENVYTEFMPDIYVHEKISSTDMLIDYLRDNGINIISPKSELLKNHLEMQLYYSYDTHWNQLGAYIGVSNVLAFWDIYMPELSERTILSKNLRDGYHYCGKDDLARIVGLLAVFDDEVEYEVDGRVLMDWETFETEQNNGEVSHFINEMAEKRASVLLVGDSYRASMLPALREMFSDVYVVHRSYYSRDLLDEITVDYLIAEYVERHSRDIGAIDFLTQ